MNKPLLQWKREIEEEIEQLRQSIAEDEINRISTSCSYTRLEAKQEQLQMIDNIIEDMNIILKDETLSDVEYQICRKYRNKVVGLKEEWE